ncbi:hypothetical protein BU15DRAFT_69212 [Melanogaster broomeanus]|nr:hypothetical protein BU15DRAFT_69212 [Melanogaster broomeanus]
MSNPLVMSAWAPGLIGLAFAGSWAHSVPFPSLELTVRQIVWRRVGQSIYYARHFPNDSRLIKFMVLVIFCSYRVMEAVHGPVKIGYLGHFTSRGIFITVPTNYLITFVVQSFYAHRVWIISGNKKHITIAILFIAILQFGIGGSKFDSLSFCSLQNGTIEFLYTDPFILYGAAASTLCDILITGAVFKYMRNSDLRRRVNFIQDLAVVFINMGALTCGGVRILIQGGSGRYWVGAPELSSADASYVNSNLAV